MLRIVQPAQNKNKCLKHADEGKATKVSDIQNGFLRRKRGSYKNTLLGDGFSKCANNKFGKCRDSCELHLFGVVICMFIRTP
jgi:hypothetical protein